MRGIWVRVLEVDLMIDELMRNCNLYLLGPFRLYVLLEVF